MPQHRRVIKPAAMQEHIDRVRRAIEVGGITKNALAAEAGLHPNTLRGADRPGWDPKVSTLGALLSAIDAIQHRRTV